jgi:hypothetical protein
LAGIGNSAQPAAWPRRVLDKSLSYVRALVVAFFADDYIPALIPFVPAGQPKSATFSVALPLASAELHCSKSAEHEVLCVCDARPCEEADCSGSAFHVFVANKSISKRLPVIEATP